MKSIPPLKMDKNLLINLPNNVKDLYDNKKNDLKKRNAILNPDFKFIGINCRFIGKTFIAYLGFSK